ncbi:relaxase/mobilization nuclease domain-containing protein [Brevundimonas diminuta]|uniref:relaxase/mobilization nuclease domain-containing protein n=1 Tax=Brevundimonas diminuta TaxID=293 RepID=UPI0019A7BC0A|nr:DUF3363 domain-containing protein [Brevundimonas diminuta]MBD3817407.1 DUF3363 domain-containing protein [Brevundimonas diminuta]
MSGPDDDFEIRPGKSRDSRASGARAKSFVGQVTRAAKKAGHTGRGFGQASRGRAGRFGRGQSAGLARRAPGQRRVIVKARTVRQFGNRFTAAPLSRHIGYLRREGVTRDGSPAEMFDAAGDHADAKAFAERCEDDRHHFRFIISPEDAGRMQDLRAFTREVMADMARDLDTKLDWVAIDHWNTDNPHVHVLVRGRRPDGEDLVIAPRYISEGLRQQAEERVTLELGPRTALEHRAALETEVEAERWTGLDRRLRDRADNAGGVLDLRPDGRQSDMDRLLIGRAGKLERLGLAESLGPGRWTLQPGLEQTLRDLSIRGDIIKTVHRAMSRGEAGPDPARFAIHDPASGDRILGRLVERGLYDELEGTAYAVVDGVDGRAHHLRFEDLELTGDAKPGAVVELRSWENGRGETWRSLAVRSDLTLPQQVTAQGATWLDRRLVAREPEALGSGFGAEVAEAMTARAEHLVAQGYARRQGQRLVFANALIETLRERELDDAAERIAARTGLEHRPSQPGEPVAGAYRERVTLASGRFAMIDDGMGFQLVPWRPAIEQQLGRHVSGTMTPGGGVDWSFGRSRGLGL